MRTVVCSIALLLISTFLPAQNLSLQWAHSYGASDIDIGQDVTTDADGNVYHIGEFRGTVDMDPGPGVYNLTSNSLNDIYITKLDAQGNFIWVKHLYNGLLGLMERAVSISIDPSGNLIITGNFSGSMDFDPGPGIFTMVTGVPIVDAACFILKLDKDGNFIWAKKLGDPVQASFPVDMKLDAAGNIYFAGYFRGTVDFDPGPGVVNLTVIAPISFDGFVLKLDNNGNFIWVSRFGGTDYNIPGSLDVDAAGNVYTTGLFKGVCDFNPGAGIYNLTSNGAEDAFIVKVDANGIFLWAESFGGNFPDNGTSLVLDPAGNIYLSGYFSGTVDIDPGPGVTTFTGNLLLNNTFFLKLDANGNLAWAKQLGDATNAITPGVITLDGQGNIYAAGHYGGPVDFDPGPGTLFIPDPTSVNVFVFKMDNNGNMVFARSIGGESAPNMALGIHVDDHKNIYVTGCFKGDDDFDPGSGVYTLSRPINEGEDAFLFKWIQCATPTSSTIIDTACGPYILNSQQYTSTGTYIQKLLNVSGCDSTITLHLTIGTPSNSTETVIHCGSNYVWEGQTFTSNGHYSVLLTGYLGCDSIRNLDLQLLTSSATTISAVICEGQNYESYTTTGTFTDTYVAKNGCDSLRTLHLTVNPKKITTVPVAICEGESYFAGGANQTVTGVYKDTFRTYLDCDSVIITNLTVKPKPKPLLGADRNICEGEVITFKPGTFESYLWHDLSTAPELTVGGTGKYWVKVTVNGCPATDTINIINKIPLPSNFLKASADSICIYETIQLKSDNNYYSYNWSTGSIQSAIQIDEPGKYVLSVKDANGCAGSDEIEIFSKECGSGIFFPNAFSPNNDGHNDIFRAKSYSNVISFWLNIYNRNGELVYRSSDPNKGWNGIYKGIPAPTAVFVWQCSYQLDGELPVYKKGTFLLMR
jgi:gliding motility-associated-like protein